MKRFIIKLLLYSTPLLLSIALYLIIDPFKVIWHYDNYYSEPYDVTLNMDYVGTTNYDNKRDKYHYDSFILGNSRSRCWRIDTWKKHIGDDASCYHMDCHGECQLGLERKVEYICKHSEKIKNVLMVIDKSVFTNPDRCTTHFRYLSPQLDSYRNFCEFHVANWRAFYTPDFFKPYMDYVLSDSVKQYMLDQGTLVKNDYYDPTQNEYLPLSSEKRIAEKKFYDEKRMKIFEGKQFPDSTAPIVIGEERLKRLKHTAAKLKGAHANVRVIISPLYDQIKMHPQDVAALKECFGAENVFDFSGVNNITSNYRNYYEDSHYRIFIADSLMNIIYHHD